MPVQGPQAGGSARVQELRLVLTHPPRHLAAQSIASAFVTEPRTPAGKCSLLGLIGSAAELLRTTVPSTYKHTLRGKNNNVWKEHSLLVICLPFGKLSGLPDLFVACLLLLIVFL